MSKKQVAPKYDPNFNKGVDWGRKIYQKEMSKASDLGYKRAFDTYEVCYHYATNPKIKKTKKGTELTDDRRMFFEGVCIGIASESVKK